MQTDSQFQLTSFGQGIHYPNSGIEAGGIHPNSFELLYIKNGKARLQWAAHSCMAEAPALFLIPATIPHILVSVDGPASYQFLIVDHLLWPIDSNDQILYANQWNYLQSNTQKLTTNWIVPKIMESFEFVYQHFSTRTAAQFASIYQACLHELMKLLQLISYQIEASQNIAPNPITYVTKQQTNSVEEIIENMINHMESNYRDPISINQLCKQEHLNPSYLIRKFKIKAGVTPARYLQNLRIKAAASYLTNSTVPIRIIVEKTGFNSVHYFTRLFTRLYGISPAQWRASKSTK